MNFDDRLRGQLQHQADDVVVEPVGDDAPKRRAGRRRARRRIAGVALVVAVIGGGTTWVATRSADDPGVEVATQDDAAPLEAIEEDDLAPTVAESEAAASRKGSSGGAAALPPSSPPPAGAPLVFAATDDAGAPGGINLFNRGADGQLYYVLSTAPGATEEEVFGPGAGFHSNDTLYTWSGDSWTNTTMADRFVSRIGSRGGLLYTVSTGGPQGEAPAVGTSADGGVTWDWVPLDLSDRFASTPSNPVGYALTSAAGPAGHLVVAWSAPFPDWEQGIQLANDAGLEIGWESHEIVGLDHEAIHYVDRGTGASCSQRLWDRLEDEMPYPHELEEEVFGDGEPTDDELAEFEAAFQEVERARMALTAELLAELATEDECSTFVSCFEAQTAWEQSRQDLERAVFVELGLIGPDDEPWAVDWNGVDEDTQRRLDEELNGIWEGGPDWPAELDCETVMWGPSWDVDDVVSITWDELGVTPPDSWNGAIAAYLVQGADVTALEVPFEPGWVQSVTALDDGFQVDIVGQTQHDWRSDWGFDGAEPAGEPGVTRWQGGAEGWVAADLGPSQAYGQVIGPDGASFSIVWGETEATSGLRRDLDGDTSFISAPDLFGSSGGAEHLGVWDLQAGPYGVAAVSVDYAAKRSMIAFSADGVAWAVTELDGDYVDGVLVGGDAVMAFVHSFDDPDVTRVLLGMS